MTTYRLTTAWRRFTGVFAGGILILMPMIGHAQTDPAAAVATTAAETAAETAADTGTLVTLVSFVKLRNELLQDIKALNKQIDSEQSEAEKVNLKQELNKL